MELDGVVWHEPKVGECHEKYFVFKMSSDMRVSQTETSKVPQKLRTQLCAAVGTASRQNGE